MKSHSSKKTFYLPRKPMYFSFSDLCGSYYPSRRQPLNFMNMFMCVCVHMFMCSFVSVHLCIHVVYIMYMCVFTNMFMWNLSCQSSGTMHLVGFRWNLSHGPEPIGLDWLADKPQGFTCLYLPRTLITSLGVYKGTGDWAQVLKFAKWSLYQLSSLSGPLVSLLYYICNSYICL